MEDVHIFEQEGIPDSGSIWVNADGVQMKNCSAEKTVAFFQPASRSERPNVVENCYADDFLLFAKTEEEIWKAAEVTRETLEELGLEVAMEKTKTVSFKEDDFDFLGFTFGHWRERKKDGKPYFIAKPKDATWKDFKQKVKAKTRKTLTLNKKAWLERVRLFVGR